MELNKKYLLLTIFQKLYLVEVIKIDVYKEYNKMEEVVVSNGNGCCLLI
jgi:hypothetical protein